MLVAIYFSLMALALGLFTSMTFLAFTHILIVIPCLFIAFKKTDFKKFPKSSWFLLGVIAAIVISIIVNQDIMEQGYKSITKVKYYLIAFFSIAPYSYWWFVLKKHELDRQKKTNHLLVAFFLVTTLVSISGMMAVFVGFNPLKWQVGYVARNGGVAGMLMNYAHNIALFQIIVAGMIVCRKEIKKYINLNFIYIVFIINAFGLYVTYTRGAWLSFLVGLPFLFFRSSKRTFVIAFMVLAILGGVSYHFAGRLVVRSQSDVERFSQWRAAFMGFKERPVFGLGYLNFEKQSHALKKKYNIEAPYFGGHAHNNYLEMLASTGLVGLLFFLLWQISWFAEMVCRNDVMGRIGLAFIAAFVAGGLTQATFVLGANLFFIMPFYALTQVRADVLK